MRPAVYIMANKRNGTLYVGVTSSLPQRAWQHREGVADGFTKKYGCKLLAWFELHETMEAAILREKQIKGGSRAKKLALIEAGIRNESTFIPASPPAKARHCERSEAIQPRLKLKRWSGLLRRLWLLAMTG